MTLRLGIGRKQTRSWSPLWRRIAEAWGARCAVGQLTLIFPDGEARVFTGDAAGPAATLHIHQGRVVWRMLIGGELGLAESFMDGDWSTPDLTALIDFGFRNEAALADPLKGRWLFRIVAAVQHRLRANTRAGARRNIAYHYDLGNDFYGEWLDETMTYSSAIFSTPDVALADAQREKYRSILTGLNIGAGDRVLEIGCGWGGFAETAAREAGAKLTSITISEEQARFARKRIEAAGLTDTVEVAVRDYRDVDGEYDRIVSIEMFEAVGEANWPVYFETVRKALAPGGRALLQIITVGDDRFETYRRNVDFIQRYIFPGGMLPSPGALKASITAAGLTLIDARFFGQSYAETLRQWNVRFQDHWDRIRSLGFDERFRRMWTYYLNSCEACFRTGATSVGHFIIERP